MALQLVQFNKLRGKETGDCAQKLRLCFLMLLKIIGFSFQQI
jgi:hypothetical protein